MKYAGTKYVFGHDYHHLNTFKKTKMKYLQNRGVFKEEPDTRSPHLPYLEISVVNHILYHMENFHERLCSRRADI